MSYKSLLLKASIIYRAKSKPLARRLRSAVRSAGFARAYVIAAPVILLTSVLYWSALGARVQLDNADTLVDPYLFKDAAVFHGASFPGQHTQLLKWPLFILVRVFGFTDASFMAVTVLMVVLTVAALVYILYRIERRPLVFGTLCLALASMLLLIPARPYDSGMLPVNMAMLTTRNLEYIFYVAAMILLARTKRIKSWSFWLATSCLALLIASDRLFLTIGLGASLIALVIYALVRGWELVGLAACWLTSQILAAAGALALLHFIDANHITHITSQTGAASPYGLVTGLHSLVIGSVYAVLGMLTNLGANPAFDVTVFRSVPHAVLARLLGMGGPAFIANALLAAGGVYAGVRIVSQSLKRGTGGPARVTTAKRVSLMLIWTTVAAVAVFALSNHDYAVDARYLTIILFTVPIAGATFAYHRRWHAGQLAGAGAVLVLAIAAGSVTALHTSNDERAALATVDQRNTKIAAAAKLHKTNVLVGDYWRVIPAEQKTRGGLTVMPLTGCTLPRADLSSSTWQPDLSKHSFTYLLSHDQKFTDYPSCSLGQVVKAYGRPNASALVAGSPDSPKEQLLFYDRGVNKSAPLTPPPAKGPATVLPITLDELPYTSCAVPTVMPIVAHQDDDLLFMNPDLIHALKAGYCVRTVYVTAGDSGFGEFYWLKRQLGAEAAYSVMLGTDTVWVERIVKLADNEFATIAAPRGNSKISLVFLHLPDGNLRGEGFGYTHYESLSKLRGHWISAIHSVDGQSAYTADQLVAALNALLVTYSPTVIYAQSTYAASRYPDHSDHVAVGQLTRLAYAAYEQGQFGDLVTIPIRYYLGYPIHGMPANVSREDLEAKTAAFLTYAQYDGGVCHTRQVCQETPTYGAYLTRQYESPY